MKNVCLITSDHDNNICELFYLPLSMGLIDSVIIVNLKRKGFGKVYFEFKQFFNAYSNDGILSNVEKNLFPKNFKFIKVDDVNSNRVFEFLKENNTKNIISCNNPSIFKEKLLTSFYCVNIHRGLLPKYKGSKQWLKPLENGEKYTGVSVHKMVKKIDSGETLFKYKIPILTGDNLTYKVNSHVQQALMKLLTSD